MLVLSISLEGGLFYTTLHSCHPSQLHPSLNATNSVPLSPLEKLKSFYFEGFWQELEMNYNMCKVHSTLCQLLYAQCTTTVIRTVFTKTTTTKREDLKRDREMGQYGREEYSVS